MAIDVQSVFQIISDFGQFNVATDWISRAAEVNPRVARAKLRVFVACDEVKDLKTRSRKKYFHFYPIHSTWAHFVYEEDNFMK